MKWLFSVLIKLWCGGIIMLLLSWLLGMCWWKKLVLQWFGVFGCRYSIVVQWQRFNELVCGFMVFLVELIICMQLWLRCWFFGVCLIQSWLVLVSWCIFVLIVQSLFGFRVLLVCMFGYILLVVGQLNFYVVLVRQWWCILLGLGRVLFIIQQLWFLVGL